MNVADLQAAINRELGRESLAVDGVFGPVTRAAFLAAFRMASAAPLSVHDLEDAARLLGHGVTAAHVGAVFDVESRGRGFHPESRRPIILPEPHVFAARTGFRFNGTHPLISVRKRNPKLYPPDQATRWERLADMVALDPVAGLSSASWGLFQIMGFNCRAAGYVDPWNFALAMATSERTQLLAFVVFLKREGLVDELARGDWAGFARRYNGPDYASGGYDQRLKAAFARRAGR